MPPVRFVALSPSPPSCLPPVLLLFDIREELEAQAFDQQSRARFRVVASLLLTFKVTENPYISQRGERAQQETSPNELRSECLCANRLCVQPVSTDLPRADDVNRTETSSAFLRIASFQQSPRMDRSVLFQNAKDDCEAFQGKQNEIQAAVFASTSLCTFLGTGRCGGVQLKRCTPLELTTTPLVVESDEYTKHRLPEQAVSRNPRPPSLPPTARSFSLSKYQQRSRSVSANDPIRTLRFCVDISLYLPGNCPSQRCPARRTRRARCSCFRSCRTRARCCWASRSRTCGSRGVSLCI